MGPPYNTILKQWVTRCPHLPYFKVQAHGGIFSLTRTYNELMVLLTSITLLFVVIGIGIMILLTFWGIYFLLVAIFPTILVFQLRRVHSINCEINLAIGILRMDDIQINLNDVIELTLITWNYRRWSKAKRLPRIYTHPVFGLEIYYWDTKNKTSSNKSIATSAIFGCYSTELEYWHKIGDYFKFILESATNRKIPFNSDPKPRKPPNDQSFIVDDLGRLVLFPARNI
jgi:hypothetical protein